MPETFLVLVGGAIGSVLRYQFGRLSMRLFGTGWPWGTLGVNIIGGFLMGLLAGWLALRSQTSGEYLRLFIGVGILGGFTTFSAFSLEVMLMIQRSEINSAVAYILTSVVAAVGALWLGLLIMRATV
jgi:CrcB protein